MICGAMRVVEPVLVAAPSPVPKVPMHVVATRRTGRCAKYTKFSSFAGPPLASTPIPVSRSTVSPQPTHWKAQLDAVGSSVGACVGARVGHSDGASVGRVEGIAVGVPVGTGVGLRVGAGVGSSVGSRDGNGVGCKVGTSVGDGVGATVGTGEGTGEGRGDGAAEGSGVGSNVGAGDGFSVGCGNRVGWIGGGGLRQFQVRYKATRLVEKTNENDLSNSKSNWRFL